ncbi:MAG: hypothetical protein HDT30_13620 [Clostridiales bacterium]|nr:hypothetical protein [Clostridiales bacterium]
MMYTSAKAALGTCTNLAAECKVLPKDSEYIESNETKMHTSARFYLKKNEYIVTV